MIADAIANPMAARYGRPVSASQIPPPTVDATPIHANAMSRSSTCFAMAFQVACNAPALMTIATTSGVSCAWVAIAAFCRAVVDGDGWRKPPALGARPAAVGGVAEAAIPD